MMIGLLARSKSSIDYPASRKSKDTSAHRRANNSCGCNDKLAARLTWPASAAADHFMKSIDRLQLHYGANKSNDNGKKIVFVVWPAPTPTTKTTTTTTLRSAPIGSHWIESIQRRRRLDVIAIEPALPPASAAFELSHAAARTQIIARPLWPTSTHARPKSGPDGSIGAHRCDRYLANWRVGGPSFVYVLSAGFVSFVGKWRLLSWRRRRHRPAPAHRPPTKR